MSQAHEHRYDIDDEGTEAPPDEYDGEGEGQREGEGPD